MFKNISAVILLSGGQDSATCLAWALKQGWTVAAAIFDYGQRHLIELDSAKMLCKQQDLPYKIIEVPQFKTLTQNALTHDLPVEHLEKGLPSTFVPGRNLVFLNLAGMLAYQLGAKHLVTGVCQTDFSGYPDCRESFIQSAEKTLSLAMDYPLKIHTPLMFLSKAETVQMMHTMGFLDWYAVTHTCYEGKRPACGKCPACQLRLKGFEQAGFTDPLAYSP